MFKKTILAYILLVCFSMITVVSCNLTDDDCGPFDDKFKTVDFQAGLKNIIISEGQGLDVQYNTLESDTISFDKFGIAMFPVGESYSLNSKQLNSFSLIPSAFACSPPNMVSEEMITDIKIFSSRNFNSEYTSGENLVELFDIVVLYRNSGYQRRNLIEFLSSDPNVPDEIFLVLKSAPETTEPIQLTVKYSQNGIDMDFYEFTTGDIIITK